MDLLVCGGGQGIEASESHPGSSEQNVPASEDFSQMSLVPMPSMVMIRKNFPKALAVGISLSFCCSAFGGITVFFPRFFKGFAGKLRSFGLGELLAVELYSHKGKLVFLS